MRSIYVRSEKPAKDGYQSIQSPWASKPVFVVPASFFFLLRIPTIFFFFLILNDQGLLYLRRDPRSRRLGYDSS